jgi:hypothetical protein
VEVQKLGIPQPPTKWWLVGIHCVSVTINKLYIFFPYDVVVTWAHYFPQKTLICTFCTQFFHQVEKFVKENIIFVEMQYLFVYHILEYLFCLCFSSFQTLEIHFWRLLFCTIISMLFESGFVLLSHWKV